MDRYQNAYLALAKATDAYNHHYGAACELADPSALPEGEFFKCLPTDYIEMLKFFDGFSTPVSLYLDIDIDPIPISGVYGVKDLPSINYEFKSELKSILEEDDDILVVGPTKRPSASKWLEGVILFSLGSGFYWYFDMDPLEGGEKGQVVFYYIMPEQAIAYVVAKNYVEFMNILSAAIHDEIGE